jgi:hypothetical protein
LARAKRFGVRPLSLYDALKRLAVSEKKPLKYPKARTQFKATIACYASAGKTSIDLAESGFAKNIRRTHGNSNTGARCYGTDDAHAKGRINAIGAIIGFTFLRLTLFDSTINTDILYARLTQDRLAKVPKAAIKVMDHTTFDQRHDRIQAIQDNAFTLESLPPYSSELNSIEHQ